MRRTAAVLLAFVVLGADRRRADEDLPPVNAAVVRFCEEHEGEKVGDGTCGALVIAALRSAAAKTSLDHRSADGGTVWGTPVERFDDALPGDVIQFNDAQVLVQSPNGTKALCSYPNHAAIVARNRGGGRIDAYEQNVATAGATSERRAKMRKRDTDLRNVLKGTIRVYRPEPRDGETE